MNLFFDFDGTLLESRPRLYRLFQQLVPASTLSFDAYWTMKRAAIGHDVILRTHFNYTSELIATFERAWLAAIEAPEWIVFDQPFPAVGEKLKAWKNDHRLHLVTARQSELAVHQQLAAFGWTELFTTVLVTRQGIEKQDLVRQFVSVEPLDWFIGDTGKDVQAGKALGIQTAAVLSGFRDAENLTKYQPSLIVPAVVDLSF